ncbi:MAG: YciC family protein [Patescibacteria group bacterium]
MKHANLTSAVDLFGKSYALVRKNLNVYALVYTVPAAMMIAGVIQVIADNQRHGWDWRHAFSLSFLGPNVGSGSSIDTASAILSIVLLFGAIASYLMAVVLNLRVTQGSKPTLRSLWNDVTQNWLWAKLLGLGIVTIMLLIVGFVLLIVPGVIMLWRLFLAPYILVDKKTKVFDALSISWNMTRGYAWPIYSIIGFSFVLALAGIIPIIGSLVAFILATAYAAAPALRYQELKK